MLLLSSFWVRKPPLIFTRHSEPQGTRRESDANGTHFIKEVFRLLSCFGGHVEVRGVVGVLPSSSRGSWRVRHKLGSPEKGELLQTTQYSHYSKFLSRVLGVVGPIPVCLDLRRVTGSRPGKGFWLPSNGIGLESSWVRSSWVIIWQDGDPLCDNTLTPCDPT